MLSGSPFSQYQCLNQSMAKCSAVKLAQVSTICMSDLAQSVMVAMVLKPCSLGSRPMKLMATLSPQSSGDGKGCKGPTGYEVGDLLYAHLAQKGMYVTLRLWCMLGQ